MKKTLLLLLTALFAFGIFAALPAAAEESEYYYVNVQILKIFPHQLGYYVIYRRAGLKTGEAFIPKEWLDRRDGRAVLNLTDQQINPYLSIVTKKGEFSHVFIVAPKDTRNPAWGILENSADLTEKFKVDKLALEF